MGNLLKWCSVSNLREVNSDIEKNLDSISDVRSSVRLNEMGYKRKEGISNNTRLQHPQQNPKTPMQKNTEQIPTERDAKGTRNTNSQHRNMKHKRLHINQRDQWATGADLGRPSAT